MSKSPIIERLEKIDAQKKKVTGISASIKSMIDYKILDEAVLELLYKERFPNEKIKLKDIGISDRNNNVSYLMALYGIAGFIFVSALSILLNSILIPLVLVGGLAFASLSMRKKWLRERLELMAERKGFNKSAFGIASSIKYLDILHVDYNEKEVKRALYKVLRTSKSLHAHEILRLQVNLYEAYIDNEELGLLEEEAFDHHYVPESFKPELIEENSTIDLLIMDDDYDSISDNAELAQKRFEEAFGGKDDDFYIEQIGRAELNKTMTEMDNSVNNITQYSDLEQKAEHRSNKSSVDVEDIISETEDAIGENSQSLEELLSVAPEKSVMDEISKIQDTSLTDNKDRTLIKHDDLDSLPFDDEDKVNIDQSPVADQDTAEENDRFDDDSDDDSLEDDLFSIMPDVPDFEGVSIKESVGSDDSISDDNLDDLLFAVNESKENK